MGSKTTDSSCYRKFGICGSAHLFEVLLLKIVNSYQNATMKLSIMNIDGLACLGRIFTRRAKIDKATDALLVRYGCAGGWREPMALWNLSKGKSCLRRYYFLRVSLLLARGYFPLGRQRVLAAGTGKMAAVYPYHSA